MKLYFFPVAPNPTKVRLYLAEKREGGATIPIEECSVNLRNGEQRSPEHLARNPRGKLPVLERLADVGVLLPIARTVHATNSPLGLPPNPGVAAHYRDELPHALGVLEATLADGRPCLAGKTPTVADCSLAAALQFGRFRGIELPDGFELVRAWDERFRQRPAAKSVLIA